nr:MAG TPA: hypothetical protein [Caudoviricetes sp.]
METQNYSKVILIHAKEWFDKTYGNSYFSVRIYLDGTLATILPFQYGYERQSWFESIKALAANGKMPEVFSEYELKHTYGITAHYIKETNQLQRDVKNWGKSNG